MASAPSIKTLAADVPQLNTQTPFITGRKIRAKSPGGASLYGANDPGNSSAATFQAFKQSVSGNKAFVLSSSANTPQNTTGGALSTANQLRVVGQVDGVIMPRSRGDAAPAAGAFIVGAGGGTLAADATVSIKGTTAANLLAGSVLLSIASSGANTKTILPGDTFVVAGDTTVYYATGGGTLTMNGTTEINVGITPPIQVAQTAGLAVTVAAAAGKTLILGTAPQVGATVESWILASTDVVTLTGGALTAGRDYEIDCYKAVVASAATDITVLV